MGLLDDKTLDDLYKKGTDALQTDNSNNNNNGNGMGGSLNQLNQSLNNGMNAAGDKADEIEIYMGEQKKEMAEGVGNAMNAMGNAMQNAGKTIQEKANEMKPQTDEKKDESK